MADQLIPRIRERLATAAETGGYFRALSARAERAMNRELEVGTVRAAHFQADAYAAHARIDSISLVTRTALQRVGELSVDEANATARTPHAEPRFRAIVDAYAILAAQVIAELGYCPR